MAWEPSWPDPCPGCRRKTVHRLRPQTVEGVLFAERSCPLCRHTWVEPAPVGLTTQHIVRVYDGDETAVGFVESIDGDVLEVAGRRVERWQLVIY